MVRDKKFKEAAVLLNAWRKEAKTPEHVAFLAVEEAKLLFADQQRSESQEVFLEALAALPSSLQPKVSDEEKKAFDSLFKSYEASVHSDEGARHFLIEAQELLQKHPSFFSLEHYIAATYANLGQFIEFYDLFFHAFQRREKCFLSKKTIGVLHLRLFEASTSEERREIHRREATRYLREAFAIEPHDSTLVMKLAFILPPNEKIVVLKSVIASLLTVSDPISRSDCFFLIQQAMEVGELNGARQLIEKARSWYQYSRALDELSDRLAAIEKDRLLVSERQSASVKNHLEQ